MSTQTTTDYRQIVAAVNEAFRKNDVEAFLAHCTDDVVWHMVGSGDQKGKETIRKGMTGPDMEGASWPEITEEHTLVDGDKVVSTGTMVTEGQGKRSRMAYSDLYLFEGDRIKEMFSYVVDLEKKG